MSRDGRTADLAELSIDPYSQIPAYAQIKDGLKLAHISREISSGETLPSIRSLARHLRVGDGVVRRAYRELCESGVLTAKHRKHVFTSPALAAAPDITSAVRECDEQCRLIMAWARERQISTVAFARLLLKRVLAEEARSPSYVFVDLCTRVAEQCADKISKAWEIRVAGVSLDEFTDLAKDKARHEHETVVLVNQHLYEDAIQVAGGMKWRMFPVQIRGDETLRRRTRHLPRRASILCVFSHEKFPRAGMAILRQCEVLFGRKWRCQGKPITEIPDLAALIRTGRYRLILFGPLVWDELPARIKRISGVAQMSWEPDPRALESSRVLAGVFL